MNKVLDANCDRLFKEFIEGLQNKETLNEKRISIRELERQVFKYKRNLNNSTYEQSILRMLSNSNDRDYFTIVNSEVRERINEEVNKKNRKNRIWRNFMDEKIIINSKYLF